MRAVLLCPGPSLAHYVPRPADLVVGVNRAATAFPCDVWACLDSPLVEKIHEQVIGAPLLLTGLISRDTIRDHGVRWRGPIMVATDMCDYFDHGTNFIQFSMTSGLVYAARWMANHGGIRGQMQIDIYGADWSGTADFDGVQAGQNRREARWRMEQELVEGRFFRLLDERGIVARRNKVQ